MSKQTDTLHSDTDPGNDEDRGVYVSGERETYLEIFNTVTDAIYILDSSFTFIDVNRGATKMYQMSAEELIGKNPADVGAPGLNDLDLITKHLNEVKEMGTTARFEFWAVRKNGEVFPKDVIVNRGKYFGKDVLIATARDISDKKEAESIINQTIENWNNTFNSLEQGVALIDTSHTIIESNQAFKELVKRFNAGKDSDKCFCLVHSLSSPVSGCPMVMLKNSFKRESMIIEIDGSVFEVTVDPITDSDNNLTGAVHIMFDITKRQRAEKIREIQYNIAHAVATTADLEELLGVVQKELDTIMDSSNFFMAFYNEETNSLFSPFYNDENDDFTEWPADQSVSGIVVKEKRSLLLTRKDYIGLVEDRGITGMGTVPESWLGVPIFSNEGVIGVYVVQSYNNPDAYDLESLKVLETLANQLSVYIGKKNQEKELLESKNRAEESDRLKSAFLANMSHEIRTPMNSIMGFIDLLQEEGLPAEQQELYFGVLKESGQRLLGTINDIMEISRIESGQSMINISVVNLSEILNYHFEVFNIEAKAKGLLLEVRNGIEKGKQVIKTDKGKLDSILTNLIKNAIKFTRVGSVIIECEIKEKLVVFRVTDSGPGIPPEKHSIIFDRFVQIESSFDRKYEGSGLGLSIAKAYTEMLGGEISVSSAPGRGTTFTFSIVYEGVNLGIQL